jgi:Flp pilus assembly protein TadD
MPRVKYVKFWIRGVFAVGLTAVALAGCVSTRDHSGFGNGAFAAGQKQLTLDQLTARHKSNPRDRNNTLQYATQLRAIGQPEQAIAALETTLSAHPKDVTISIAYAKALTAAGRFDQSLNVIDNVLRPDAPDWNALLVKGATLDQMGRNGEARRLYAQAAALAPNEASIETNLGLSYAMTNELKLAEQHLRKAVTMNGASTQTRQNLALVLGLQGRFDDARKIYAAELPPEKVEANMAYIRALLTQQNRWDLLKE